MVKNIVMDKNKKVVKTWNALADNNIFAIWLGEQFRSQILSLPNGTSLNI